MPQGYYDDMAGFSHQGVLEALHECAAVCHYTATVVKRRYADVMRAHQLQLLHDCAEMCLLTARYIAGLSPFAKEAALLCARICEVCGTACSHHADQASQHCARVCFMCARECRAFAMR